MPYCIKYKEKNGAIRYLNQECRPSEVPYYWKKQTSAEAVIRARTLKNGIKYRCLPAEAVDTVNKESETKANSIIPRVTLAEASNPEKVANAFRVIAENARYLDQMIEDCEKAVNKEDGVAQDILHYVEFNECDSEMVLKLYQILKESRKERRKKKDLLIFLRLLNGIVSEKDRFEIIKAIESYDSRAYRPRELKDLFETETANR